MGVATRVLGLHLLGFGGPDNLVLRRTPHAESGPMSVYTEGDEGMTGQPKLTEWFHRRGSQTLP